MEQGFLKIAAVTPKIKVADPEYNADEIIRLLEEAEKSGARIAVFPELCLSGYTFADLFLQDLLLRSCEEQLIRIVEETDDFDILSFIGLPVEKDGKLYNAAAVIHQGNVLAFIPKANIPSYAEFYEGRHLRPETGRRNHFYLESGRCRLEQIFCFRMGIRFLSLCWRRKSVKMCG